MPIPLDKKLYASSREKIMKVYKKNSAFASGAIVKDYKQRGGTYAKDDKEPKLARWFEEKWININPLIDKKEVGDYPVFRPTLKVNSKTPVLFQDISKSELKKQYYLKQKLKGDKNLPKFIAHHESVKKGKGLKADTLKGLLRATYKDKADENIDGYQLDRGLSKGKSKVYYNPQTQHAVVAHRGTSGFTDWANNLAFAVGGEKLYKLTPRYREAKAQQEAAQQKYGKKNISTIGHSQGGLQAELLGKDTGEIITLNKATRPFEDLKQKNQYDIRSKGDLVSGLNPFEPNYDYKIEAKSRSPLTEHNTGVLGRLGSKELGQPLTTTPS
jgi:hypothetical protein